MVSTYLPKSHWRTGSRCPDKMFDIFRGLMLGRPISETASATGLSKPTVRKNYEYLLSELFSDFRFSECVMTLLQGFMFRDITGSDHYFLKVTREVFDNIIKKFDPANEVYCALNCPHAPRVQDVNTNAERVDTAIVRLLKNTEKCDQCKSLMRPLLSLQLRYSRLSYFKRHRNVHKLPEPERHLRLFLCITFINVYREAYTQMLTKLSHKELSSTERQTEMIIIILSEMAQDLITLGKISYVDLILLYSSIGDRGGLLEWVPNHQEKRSEKLAAKYSKSRGERASI